MIDEKQQNNSPEVISTIGESVEIKETQGLSRDISVQSSGFDASYSLTE